MQAAVVALMILLVAGCASMRALSTVSEGATGRLNVPSFTRGAGGVETPVVVTGELSLPPEAPRRVPAVILLHSCSGVTPNLGEWATAVNRMGFAAFVLDSFTARGVTEVCTGRTPVSIGSRLSDVYRALELLSAHPRIDPRRIAALGFSHGGWVALWASQAQFETRFLRANVDFAAFAALYPAGCNARLLNEAAMAPGAVRLFVGTADDWTPIAACRGWVARRHDAGRNVSLVAYDGAMHAFDVPYFSPPQRWHGIFNAGGCVLTEQSDGGFLDTDGRPLSPASKCVTRGATLGYNAAAHEKVVADVKTFLDQSFSRR